MHLEIWALIRMEDLSASTELIQIIWWVPNHASCMSRWRANLPLILLKRSMLLIMEVIVDVIVARIMLLLHWLERATTPLIPYMLRISIMTRHERHSWELMAVERMSMRLHHHMWMSGRVHSIMMSWLWLEALQKRHFWLLALSWSKQPSTESSHSCMIHSAGHEVSIITSHLFLHPHYFWIRVIIRLLVVHFLRMW